MNKELLNQGYLGPVKSTAMIHKLRSLLSESAQFSNMTHREKYDAITKILNKELTKLRKSDTLVEKVVTGESRGQKHYYKKEPFEAYVAQLKERLMDEYGIPRK